MSGVGRYCLGTAVAASGLMQVINIDFVRLVPALPNWMPVPAFWAVASGLLLVLIGGAILIGYRAGMAAMILGGLLLGSFLLQRVPEIVSNPGAGFIWTNPAKVLALFGGAVLLGSILPGGQARWLGKLSVSAAWLLAVFLLICGAQHFYYAGFVDTLVPSWIPPGQRFWTCFTGGSLLAGGLGLLVPRTKRLAALLSGLMIFLWVLLLHLPRSLELKSAFELAGAFEALALAGVAWLVAGNCPAKRSESRSETAA